MVFIIMMTIDDEVLEVQWMTITELVNINLGDLTSIVDVPLQLLLKLVNLKFKIYHPNEGYFALLFSLRIINKISESCLIRLSLNAIQFNFHSFMNVFNLLS